MVPSTSDVVEDCGRPLKTIRDCGYMLISIFLQTLCCSHREMLPRHVASKFARPGKYRVCHCYCGQNLRQLSCIFILKKFKRHTVAHTSMYAMYAMYVVICWGCSIILFPERCFGNIRVRFLYFHCPKALPFDISQTAGRC